MGMLEECRERFQTLCESRGIAADAAVRIAPLSPEQAIGDKAGGEFPIKKGKEVVIEAIFLGARGQAFTDHPSHFVGTLGDSFHLDLTQITQRAFFTATLNAVLRFLGIAQGTVHCRNDAPHRCGSEIAKHVIHRYGKVRVGLVGLQPSILKGLVEVLGSDYVRVVDLNQETIGQDRSGVRIWDGSTRLLELVGFSELGLVTGSSIVNDTIDHISALFAEGRKPVLYYGNTISGVAALCGLPRICPFGQ